MSIGYLVLALIVAAALALYSGKFIRHGDGPLLSDEELDRASLHAFYREIIFLLLGLALGAALFCLFAGYAFATY